MVSQVPAAIIFTAPVGILLTGESLPICNPLLKQELENCATWAKSDTSPICVWTPS